MNEQPGGFRTEVAQSSNLKRPSRQIQGYDSAAEWVEGFNSNAGKEPGDTKKGAVRILDIVTSGKGLPAVLALGDE